MCRDMLMPLLSNPITTKLGPLEVEQLVRKAVEIEKEINHQLKPRFPSIKLEPEEEVPPFTDEEAQMVEDIRST